MEHFSFSFSFFEWSTFGNFAYSFHQVSLFFFHIISNHNPMRYQQVYALLILCQEKRKTYKKLKLATWVKQRKDKQAQKGSLRIICFRLALWLKWLKFLIPLSSSYTHVM